MAEKKRISFDDILRLWNASQSKRRGALLMLVLDSCHSGKWVEEARERNLQDVAVQAACASDEVTIDGWFTSLLVRYHNKKVSRDEALTSARVSHAKTMHPCAYVPWKDTNEPLVCEKLDREFTMLSVE